MWNFLEGLFVNFLNKLIKDQSNILKMFIKIARLFVDYILHQFKTHV
jgi:hypothetical protein